MEIQINSKVDIEELEISIRSQLNEKEMAKLAINLGIDGDLTYELVLLKELCDIVSETYPVKEFDELMTPITEKLLELKPLLTKALKY